MQTDPVCGMQVDEKSAAANSNYKDKTYFFCDLHCKDRFEQSPEAYINDAGKPSTGDRTRFYSKEQSQSEKKENSKLVLPIAGMSCAACAATIEKALGQVEGVSKAVVNFAVEKATVEYDSDLVKQADLANAVQSAGYSVWVRKKRPSLRLAE